METAEVVPSTVGGFVGSGLVGQEVQDWVPENGLASFDYTNGYRFDPASQTLIVDSETATVSIARYVSSVVQGLPENPLRTGDKVRVTYGAYFRYLGTVTGTTMTYTERPEALKHQARFVVRFTAQLLGTYAIALSKRVCWQELPEESAEDRITRWVNIITDPGPWDGD
ncbi:hypothetical protein [Lentzea terrae]|uniref:hypothetical protein n=1 Tax=Lentzea terrae TaxID=2200761 RepID=UPI0013001C31|nr:hypothetical protein [Lentzea terrae]